MLAFMDTEKAEAPARAQVCNIMANLNGVCKVAYNLFGNAFMHSNTKTSQKMKLQTFDKVTPPKY